MQPIELENSYIPEPAAPCQIKHHICSALSVIFFLGGIFLMLAAYRVLPQSPNPISELGLAKLAYPLFAFGTFFVLYLILSKRSLYPNAEYRIAPTRGDFVFTRQEVQRSIERIIAELKATQVKIDGYSESMTAYEIFSELDAAYYKDSPASFDVDHHCKMIEEGVCYGICQELGLSKSPTNMCDALKVLDREKVLYRQIMHQIYGARSPSLLSNFMFATAASFKGKTDAEQAKLKAHWRAHMSEMLPHSVTKHLKFTNELSSLSSVFRSQFPKEYYNEPTIRGWIELVVRPKHESGLFATPASSEAVGHAFWFQFSTGEERCYLINSLDAWYGVFEFPNFDSFIQAIYDQINAAGDVKEYEIFLFAPASKA